MRLQKTKKGWDLIVENFSDRLKALRKERNMSQMALAEMVGVSAQSVSRWETGNCMPDIFQIVPLARVLGTTSDHLLGVDNFDENEIEAAYREINNMFKFSTRNNSTPGKQHHELVKRGYEILYPLAYKNPTNYGLLLNCANHGAGYLRDVIIGQRFYLSPKEINILYNDVERLYSMVVSYDTNIGRKTEAKNGLIDIYCTMEYFEKAFIEAQDLSEYDNKIALCDISRSKRDFEKLETHARDALYMATHEYMSQLYTLARAYSIQGEPKREEAIAVWQKLCDVADMNRGILGDSKALSRKMSALLGLAKEYLRRGDVEKCLDYTEKLADSAVIYYYSSVESMTGNAVIDKLYLNSDPLHNSGEIPESFEYLKDNLKWWLIACHEECADREGNSVVTHDRYKKCMERIENL